MFTRFKTFPNILNDYHNFTENSAKNSFHEARSIERNQASIKGSFRSIEQESSINRVRQKLQINFLDQFDRSNKISEKSKIIKLEFSQRKFQILKYNIIHFTNEYSLTLYH